jgi:peroxiredoxin
MLTRSRLAGAALLLACLARLAQADERAPLPEPVQAIITAMGLEKIADISYNDPSGKPITAEQFAQMRKDGQPYTVTKSARPGQPQFAILSITTKEAIKAMAAPPPKLKAGDLFPPFNLAKLDGSALDNEALRGRYSLVNFYFAQCAPCVKEVPELNTLAESRDDMNFVGITFDSAEETRKFAADTKFGWILAPDAKKLIDELRVRSYPSFVLLDPQGAVVAVERHDEIIAQDKSVTAWLARVAPQ